MSLLLEHDRKFKKTQVISAASVFRYGFLSVSALSILLALVYLGQNATEPSKQQTIQLYETDQCETASHQRSKCCTSQENAVLGGIDFVELFNLPDDTSVPALGDPAIASHLNTGFGKFKFTFLNEENREKFVENPWRYAPAWGGFCAYELGQSAKNFASSNSVKHMLGPSIDLSTWTIVKDRLFFFGGEEQKSNFLHSLPDAISSGDALWSNSFGTLNDGLFDTTCYSIPDHNEHDLLNIPKASSPLMEQQDLGTLMQDDIFLNAMEELEHDDIFVNALKELGLEVQTTVTATENNGMGGVEIFDTEMVGGYLVERGEDGKIIAVDGKPVAFVQRNNFVDQSLYDKYASERELWNPSKQFYIPTKQSFFGKHPVNVDDQGIITHVDGIPVILNGYTQKASLESGTVTNLDNSISNVEIQQTVQQNSIPATQSFFDKHSATTDNKGFITHVDGIPVIFNSHTQKASLELGLITHFDDIPIISSGHTKKVVEGTGNNLVDQSSHRKHAGGRKHTGT